MTDLAKRQFDDMDTMTLGTVLAKSGYFSDSKDAAQAVVKVLAGRELGIGPIASMMNITIVQGKITLSAGLIASSIKRSGIYNYRVIEHSDRICTLEFSERGEVAGQSTYSIEDATKAGLTGKDVWKKYPRNMLFARAMSNGARWYCPDVFNGPVYTPDELERSETPVLEAVDTSTGEIIVSEQEQTIARIEDLLKQERALQDHLGQIPMPTATGNWQKLPYEELRAIGNQVWKSVKELKYVVYQQEEQMKEAA